MTGSMTALSGEEEEGWRDVEVEEEVLGKRGLKVGELWAEERGDDEQGWVEGMRGNESINKYRHN